MLFLPATSISQNCPWPTELFAIHLYVRCTVKSSSSFRKLAGSPLFSLFRTSDITVVSLSLFSDHSKFICVLYKEKNYFHLNSKNNVLVLVFVWCLTIPFRYSFVFKRWLECPINTYFNVQYITILYRLFQHNYDDKISCVCE